MEGGLPRAQIARIDVGREVVLIDSRNLVSEKGVVAEIIIDPGRPQIDDGNLAPFLMNKPLCFDLRGTVRQARFEWPVFVDQLSRPGSTVHEHRTCENELLDL